MEIIKLAREKDLLLIEDCCEAHGANYGGLKVGTFGDMSNFSFYFGHHMTTIEGGMISTNDKTLYESAKMYRSHGMTREAGEGIQSYYKNHYPDLKSLAFWCRNKNISKLKKEFNKNKNRIGLGLVFHITPSNIPTNFAYSPSNFSTILPLTNFPL